MSQTRSMKLQTAAHIKIATASVIRRAIKSAKQPDGSMSVKDAKDIVSMLDSLRESIKVEELEKQIEDREKDKASKPSKPELVKASK